MMTGQYPAMSMTFVDREIRALRARGIEVATYSQKAPNQKSLQGAFQIEEAERVVCLRRRLKEPGALVAAILVALRRPARFLSTLRLASQTAPPGFKGGLRQLFYLLEAVVLARDFAQQKVCHVHNHLGDASGTVALLAAELRSIPFSMTLHGPEIFWDRAYWSLSRKIRKSQFTACISGYAMAQAMLVTEGSHREKLHIVHCGIELDNYSRTKRSSGLTSLLFIGRLEYRKGLHVLLHAFAELRGLGHDARLTIIGDGPEREALSQMSGSLMLQDRVSFVGAKTEAEVADYLASADILLAPSLSEGLPTVILEALASEVPVIASSVAGIAEAVRQNETGLLVSPCSPEELTQAIIEMLDRPDRRISMGQAGRRLVEAEYDVLQTAAKLAGLIFARNQE